MVASCFRQLAGARCQHQLECLLQVLWTRICFKLQPRDNSRSDCNFALRQRPDFESTLKTNSPAIARAGPLLVTPAATFANKRRASRDARRSSRQKGQASAVIDFIDAHPGWSISWVRPDTPAAARRCLHKINRLSPHNPAKWADTSLVHVRPQYRVAECQIDHV